MPLGAEVGLGDIVLDGEPLPLHRGHSTVTAVSYFRPMYCGQTPGWIKMLLRTEVGLGPARPLLDRTWSPESVAKLLATDVAI